MGMPGGSGIEKALKLIRSMPRVALNNIREQPTDWVHRYKQRPPRGRGQHRGRKRGYGHKGAMQHHTLPRLGFESGATPFYLLIPKEPQYNRYHYLRRQYPPFSLLTLQRSIDLGRIDPSQPIDLNSLTRTNIFSMDTLQFHYGVNLTDEGADIFATKINIEVQKVESELAIAAIERCGGVITTRYFDPISLEALINPEKFFRSGQPIPKCKLPSAKVAEYYLDPQNRGYLAKPDDIKHQRFLLSQKYGYVLPDFNSDPDRIMLSPRKTNSQVFYGLQPGWLVNLRDKSVYRSIDPEISAYFES